jgi:hypothetical protein
MLAIFLHGQQVAIHPRSLAQGRFSTRPEHMPANHRFVLNANGGWFQREARKIGPNTTAYITALLKSRRYPQHAYRSCLGIFSLARKHTHPRMEIACQILLEADLLSYRDLKSELERLMAARSPEPPLPAHENVRGNNYYQ